MTLRRDVEILIAKSIPGLGGGQTAVRWRLLSEWARTGSVSVARLAEAHLDASAILEEAGQKPQPGCVYGVWASGGPTDTTVFDPVALAVTGTKPFSSGLGVIDRSLVTAKDVDGARWLVDIDVSDLASPTAWPTPALVDTKTGDADISSRAARPVGDPGFYLNRPGFWYGAVGPAACWAGAAIGVVDYATRTLADDPFRRAAQGELLAQQKLIEAVLQRNGDLIDAGAMSTQEARAEAHSVRHLIERSCAIIVDGFSQAYGPRPFVTDGALTQRVMDIQLYCRQQHAERDLAALAQAALTQVALVQATPEGARA